MPSFKKKIYTEPVVCKHNNDLSKDWYVFFRYKHEGKEYKFKRREGINRIKNLDDKLKAMEELLFEIQFDLRNGWNPILDPKRELVYSMLVVKNEVVKKQKAKRETKPTKAELRAFFDAGRGGKMKRKH